MNNWHNLLTLRGRNEAVRSSIELERYRIEFLALGWNEKAWNALLSWNKEHDLSLRDTLRWAKKAVAFGVSLPEDLDIDRWQKVVQEKNILFWLGIGGT